MSLYAAGIAWIFLNRDVFRHLQLHWYAHPQALSASIQRSSKQAFRGEPLLDASVAAGLTLQWHLFCEIESG
jgi:hypothetical protein